MLDSCPLVRSTGIDVDSGKAFVWLPGSLPFFVTDVSQLVIHCPENCRQYATRVDEHVPIFTSQVKFTHGAANPVGDPSGGFSEEDPAAVPSAIRSLDSHPAEIRARQILSSDGNVSCHAVRNLFNLVDKEPAARGDHGDSFSTGLYRVGGALGLRTSAHRVPLVTRAFNKFARAKVPNFGYTTLCIFSNVTTGPHRDFHNANLDNAIISLAGFTGGGVWVEESGGTTPCPGDPSKLGRILSFKNGVIRLRAKSVTHATMPWKGDRVVMVLFSAKHPSDVKEVHCEELRALGFPIDSCDEPLPAFAAEAPEGPAADAPPDGPEAGDDAEGSGELLQDDGSEDKVPERIVKRCQSSTDCSTSRRILSVTSVIRLACFQGVFAGSLVIQRLSLTLLKRQSSEKSLLRIAHMCLDRLTIPMLLTNLTLCCACGTNTLVCSLPFLGMTVQQMRSSLGIKSLLGVEFVPSL